MRSCVYTIRRPEVFHQCSNAKMYFNFIHQSCQRPRRLSLRRFAIKVTAHSVMQPAPSRTQDSHQCHLAADCDLAPPAFAEPIHIFLGSWPGDPELLHFSDESSSLKSQACSGTTRSTNNPA